MKNSITLFFILFSMFTIGNAQEIRIHSITTDRQASGDRGYTLDGLRMVNHATPKIINPDHFGDMVYPKYTNLTHGYGVVGSLEEITSIEDIDIFFFGMFNKFEPTLNQFTEAEIDSLYAWSKNGGKLIIGASASYLDFNFDPSILNAKWGFSIEAIDPNQQILPTDEGLNTAIFEGPFGSVPMANQGGLAQGSFISIPEGAVVLGVDTAGLPTLILDCNTLDLIISDIDAFTDLGGISSGYEIQNDNDIFLLNTIVYMDQLQGPPVISQDGSTLSAGSYLSYQWMLDGLPIGGATDSTYTVTADGNYSVQVSMSCGCTVTSEPYFASLSGTEDFFQPHQVQVFPNPVTDKMVLKFHAPENAFLQLSVYNGSGQEVPSLSRALMLTGGYQAIDLDVGGLPSGVYGAALAIGGQMKTVRFVR